MGEIKTGSWFSLPKLFHTSGVSKYKYDPNNINPVEDISIQNYLNRRFTGFKTQLVL